MDNTQSSSKQEPSLINKFKSLLTRGWRERWNEIQWGIHVMRTVSEVEKGQTADIKTPVDTRELAELLLQQALVGSQPNNMILTYLKHSVSCQVVPATAAFKYITQYEEYNKPYCLLALINIARDFAVHMNLGTESCIHVSRSIQSLIYWLLKVMLKSVQRFQENRQLEYQNVLHTAALASQKITESMTVRGLMYVARSEDLDTFREMEQTELNVRGTLSQIPADAIPAHVRQDVSSISFLTRVKDMVLPYDPVLDLTHLPINPAIVTIVAIEAILNPTSDVQPFVDQMLVLEKMMPYDPVLDLTHLPINPAIVTIVAIEAILNPTSDVQPFVDQMLVLEKMMKLQRPYLFCELFRGCFMGLRDIKAGDSQEQYRWCAFTYLKVPQILQKIQQQSPCRDFSSDLEMGFEKLLNSPFMLDLVDLEHKVDSVVILLNECSKYNLLTEGQAKRLSQRRINESQVPRPIEPPPQGKQPCITLVIKAEPTVHSILKTLDADYSKNQENLLSVLCHILSGKSFELILSAAAATGKLQMLCFKLIKFNEFTKHSPSDGGKMAQTRALLFDISFLMLCHITQIYGTEVITTSNEIIQTFFVQWALRCLPEDGKYKSVDIGLPVESSKVDGLLSAITSRTDFMQGAPKWHEICANMPYAVQEVLFAWEHGALNSENIKMIMAYVKSRMLCFPVVVSAWMCSYINMLSEDARGKPLSMLQQLVQPINGDGNPPYYNERSHLSQQIMQKMIFDILPPSIRPPAIQYVPAKSLPADVMEKTMKTVFTKGWLDLENLHTLEALLNLCGSDWFSDRLVMHMLDTYKVDELISHLGLTFSIVHMDLEHITRSLLVHTIPSLLMSADKQNMLTDPRGYILAKLCIIVKFPIEMHMLDTYKVDELISHLGLTFSIVHMDLEHITRSLLVHTIPSLLMSADKQNMLTDPRGYMLAKLCVMAISAGQTAKSAQKDTSLLFRRGRKRSRKDFDMDDFEETETRPPKRSKTMEPQITLDFEGFNFDDFLNSKEDGEMTPTIDTKDPLNKAMINLFRLMNTIIHDKDVSPRTSFIVSFIDEAVHCGPQQSRYILQFMPPNMLYQVLKCIPGGFSNEQILQICDLSTVTGRKIAAKCLYQVLKCIPGGFSNEQILQICDLSTVTGRKIAAKCVCQNSRYFNE